jgi:hypothetical protein
MSEVCDYERIRKWMDSPEGQEALERESEKIARAERVKKNCAKRIKAMPMAEQDKWMRRVIAKYASDGYKNRWYDRGIFPPEDLFYYIGDFIFNNGIFVGTASDGEPIYQYNHWRMDCKYGQGETHYNFEYSDSLPNRADESTKEHSYVGSDNYWENIFDIESNRSKDLHNAFAELHDTLVNEIIGFCKEHNLAVDEVSLNVSGILGSKQAGEWTSATDSCMSMYTADDDNGIDRSKPFLYRI